ncbi:MAG: CHC2 zinc finger domain-containing protein [Bacillota bacterium]
MNSILPDIWNVAQNHGLSQYRSVSGRPNERRVNCPFCGDTKGQHLYLNTEKNTFKCYRCSASGGVIAFIALLTGRTEQDVLEELKGEQPKQIKKARIHPAEKLSVMQLRMMGYRSRPNWQLMRKRDKDYAENSLEMVWSDWQAFINLELIRAYRTLILAIADGNYLLAIDRITARSKEIGIDLNGPVLRAYSQRKQAEWAREGQELAQLYLQPVLKDTLPQGKKSGAA